MNIFLLLLFLISANTFCSINNENQKFIQKLEKRYTSKRNLERHKFGPKSFRLSSTNFERLCPSAPCKKRTQPYDISVAFKAKRKLTYEINSQPQSKF
jgi:hypothetical protein